MSAHDHTTRVDGCLRCELTHVPHAQPDVLTRRPDLVDLAAVGINRALALREEA